MKQTLLNTTIALLALTTIFNTSFAQTKTPSYKAIQVFKGSDIIWGFDFLSESEILLTEKKGSIRLVDLKTGSSQTVSGGPEPIVNGQGGLMDIKIQKADGKTWVYFTSTVAPEKGAHRGEKQTTALFRGTLSSGGPSPKIENLKRLFEAEPAIDSGYHFGSRLVLQGDGLYMTVGERNERDRAQDLTQHWGKILHLTLLGQPHRDNPFIKGEKVDGKVPKPEIFSFGHRNPQGIAIHPVSKEIYNSEHGPRGGDEINLVKSGKNYGWPIITHGREYWGPSIGTKEKAGLEQALKYYVPSIAPGSLMIYSGAKFPQFKDRMFLGALVLQHLNIVNIETGEELRLFENRGYRVRNVASSPSGEIYFSTDSGQILRVSN